MQAANTKFYITLLLVGLCIFLATAAPTESTAKGVTSLDGSDESNEDQNPKTAGDSANAHSASTNVKTHDHDDAVQVPAQTGVIQPAVLPQPAATHVRVKRNKNPIRYHAKNIRRQ